MLLKKIQKKCFLTAVTVSEVWSIAPQTAASQELTNKTWL